MRVTLAHLVECQPPCLLAQRIRGRDDDREAMGSMGAHASRAFVICFGKRSAVCGYGHVQVSSRSRDWKDELYEKLIGDPATATDTLHSKVVTNTRLRAVLKLAQVIHVQIRHLVEGCCCLHTKADFQMVCWQCRRPDIMHHLRQASVCAIVCGHTRRKHS